MFFSPSVLGFLGIRFRGVPKSELSLGLDGLRWYPSQRTGKNRASESTPSFRTQII